MSKLDLNNIKLNISEQDIETLSESFSLTTISENSNNNKKMATLMAAKEIAHTLKSFSGRAEHLEFFITSVDRFFNRYFAETNDETLKEFVFSTIQSKIIDEAGDFILCHPEFNSWPLIKNALRRKFGDKISRQTLSQQLNFLTRHKNESALDFLDRLRLLKNRISIKINSEGLIPATQAALNEQTELNAIAVLMANVSSELRTLLMFNNPQDLDDAYTIALNHSLIEQQINTRQNPNFQDKQLHRSPSNLPKIHTQRNNYVPNFPPQNFNAPYHMHMPNFNFPQQTFHPNNINTFTPRSTFPNQPIKLQPRPVNHNFPTNRQVFGKPKDVFSKENSHKPTEPPKPMSGVSIIPRQTSQRPIQQRPHHWTQNSPRNPYSFQEVTYLSNETPITGNHTIDENLYDCEIYSPANFPAEYNQYETFQEQQEDQYYLNQSDDNINDLEKENFLVQAPPENIIT